MSKPTEIDKLKHWIDSEFSILHIYALVIMWLLTHGILPHVIIGVLAFVNIFYAVKRAVWIGKQDRNYLKVKD